MEINAVGKLKDALKGLLGDKKTLIKILSVALILIAALILRIHDENKADITIETTDTAAEETEYSEDSNVRTQPIFVDIGGAVKNPGVYQVSEDTRLFQVIEMAGGLSEEADADHVNRLTGHLLLRTDKR